MDELMDPGGCVVPLEIELTEARAAIAKIRGALEEIHEAMDNARTHKFQPLSVAWRIAENIELVCEDALSATPSDCYAQIRAEVLEEPANWFAGQPEEEFCGKEVAWIIRKQFKDKP